MKFYVVKRSLEQTTFSFWVNFDLHDSLCDIAWLEQKEKYMYWQE